MWQMGTPGGLSFIGTGSRDGRGVVEAAGLIVDAGRQRAASFGSQ
jgi:hypothetical protein